MTTISISLSGECLDQLRKWAERSGLTPEEFLRHRVEQLLEPPLGFGTRGVHDMAAIPLSDEHLVTLQQIHQNAAWVAENIGKQSGIEPFAYTAESVDYLEQFLVRQEAMVKASQLGINKYV